MICQTNDTEVHKPMRKEFCSLQERLCLEKTVTSQGGLKQCSDEENILLLSLVFSNEQMHLQGCNCGATRPSCSIVWYRLA